MEPSRIIKILIVFFFVSSQLALAESDQSINWAVDDLEGLRMGMSKSDAERILGTKLKPAGREESYRISGHAKWLGNIIVFRDWTSHNFEFSNNRLFDIWFCSLAGYEDVILVNLFEEYGNARYKDGAGNGGCNFFDRERTIRIESPKRVDKGSINVYQWNDGATTVQVCDEIDNGERLFMVHITSKKYNPYP